MSLKFVLLETFVEPRRPPALSASDLHEYHGVALAWPERFDELLGSLRRIRGS